MRILFVVFLLFMLPCPIQAQENSGAAGESATAPIKPAKTRIEVDERAGIIRFFIDGQEKATLNADGLHIQGDIDYAGTIRDVGAAGSDSPARETQENADAQ